MVATPLGITAQRSITLEIGLACRGIGPKQVKEKSASSKDVFSPNGTKAKSKLETMGSASDVFQRLFVDECEPLNESNTNVSSHPPQHHAQKLCTFWTKGTCKKGDACKFIHTTIDKSSFPNDDCKSVIIEAAGFALKHYFSKPYSKMPHTFIGEAYDYYYDWEPIEFDGFGKVFRTNHNMISSMRKAMLVQPACMATGFKPNDKQLKTMMVAMIFEVHACLSFCGVLSAIWPSFAVRRSTRTDICLASSHALLPTWTGYGTRVRDRLP